MRGRATHQCHTPKADDSLLQQPQALIVLQIGVWSHWLPLHPHWEFLTDLILVRSSLGNRHCCEFMLLASKLCPEDRISEHSFARSVFFLPPLLGEGVGVVVFEVDVPPMAKHCSNLHSALRAGWGIAYCQGQKEVSLTTVESHTNLWGNKYLGGILTTWPFSKSGATGSPQGSVTSLAIHFKPYLQHEAPILSFGAGLKSNRKVVSYPCNSSAAIVDSHVSIVACTCTV